MKLNFPKPVLAIVVLLLIAGGIYFLESQKVSPAEVSDRDTTISAERCDQPAHQIVAPAGYINTGGEVVTIEEFIGQEVILVDFMTYSCINCQRTFPYLNAWWDKYQDAGLQIIGMHTPEFGFEKDYDNVQTAMEKFGITYPVVLDNDYGTWRAYGNRYWPRKYLIDINGCIVYDHIGEGDYAETETKIQELLRERNDQLGLAASVPSGTVDPAAKERAVGVRTPEIYFGAARNDDYLANGAAGVEGEQHFTTPDELAADKLYLDGRWDVHDEYAEALDAGASVHIKYQAKEVYAVMAAPEGARITIYQDGEVVETITVEDEQLYVLIENDAAGEHELEIVADEPGVQMFTFTFG